MFLLNAFCSCNSSGDVKYVLLGEYVLDSTEDEATPILFNVTEIIKHDDFRHAVKYNDIALLRLNQTVTFTQYIRPACLYEFPTFPESAENKAQAIGWGRVNNEGKTSKTLLKVSLELYTANECTYAYHNVGTFSTLTKGIMHDQQFCAGDHNERKDTCKVNIKYSSILVENKLPILILKSFLIID